MNSHFHIHSIVEYVTTKLLLQQPKQKANTPEIPSKTITRTHFLHVLCGVVQLC